MQSINQFAHNPAAAQAINGVVYSVQQGAVASGFSAGGFDCGVESGLVELNRVCPLANPGIGAQDGKAEGRTKTEGRRVEVGR